MAIKKDDEKKKKKEYEMDQDTPLPQKGDMTDSYKEAEDELLAEDQIPAEATPGEDEGLGEETITVSSEQAPELSGVKEGDTLQVVSVSDGNIVLKVMAGEMPAEVPV